MALKKLRDLLVDFPFVDDASLAVAVSGLITPLVRYACLAVPLHGVTAPKKRSGKTTIAILPCCLVMGRPAASLSQADSRAEDQKRFLAVLIEGRPVAVIDNIERELRSDTLCIILTAEVYSDRLLGTNKIVEVPSKATFFATGNNLTLAGDLTSRVILCALDPECERPGERSFKFPKLVEEAISRRAELVVAALTIVRAYLAAGEPKPDVPNFAGFDDWCRFVRYPLIWLGMADPYETVRRVEANDPVREQLLALLTTWLNVFASEQVKVGDVIKEATNPNGPTAKVDARAALHEVLIEVAGRSGKISPTGLGKFLATYEKRVEGGLRFEKAGKAKGAILWRVKVMGGDSQVPATPDGPVTPPSSGEVGEDGELVPVGPGNESGEEVIVSIKHVGKHKIITRTKVGKKPGAGIGNPVPQSGNQPHQGHHPHAEALDLNEPDAAVSASNNSVEDAPASPTVDPTKSDAQGEPTVDYAEDL